MALAVATAPGARPVAGQEEAETLTASVHTARLPVTFRWGLQRPDLVRYNRVEGLSVGARGQLRPHTPVGPLSLTLTVRVGTADKEPSARLDATREGLERRITWSAFHELAAVDDQVRHLGLGNSITALLLGRDDGEYYRRSGLWSEWSPPSFRRRSFLVRGYAEFHQAAETATSFALARARDDAWAFRDNLAAERGWELGALVIVAPTWGSDPRSPRGGVDVRLQAAGGDWAYSRVAGTGHLQMPLHRDLRLGLEAAAGTSWGEPPPQRLWFLGGPMSLRGYGPRVLEGPSFTRARGELARSFAFGALSGFVDLGWAGERDNVRLDDALLSAGAGVGLVDGLIHVDAAWGLWNPKGFRLELYLDATP